MGKRQRRRQRKQGPEIMRVPSPKTRLRPLFSLMGEITRAADASFVSFEGEMSPIIRFDLGVLERGVNGLKVARTLLQDGHWEFAASVGRQLFELLVNVEHIGSLPDREEAIFRFAKYGLLQATRHQRETMLYNQTTGRPVDTERFDHLNRMLEEAFPEFRKSTKAGSPSWASSWSGKTAKALAEESSSPLRQHQYRLLFTPWSEQIHAAPGAMIEYMFRTSSDDWPQDLITADDQSIHELGAMTTVLFMELWQALPLAPELAPERRLEWATRLKAQALARME